MRIAMITVFTLILSHPHAEAQTSTTVLFSGAAQFSKENLAPTEVASGFAFTEGPTPDGVGGIWFTDITNANIHRFDIASGETTLENANSGGANGLMFDGQGRLLAAEGNAQQLTRKDGDSVEVLADMWDDKRLNSPNDIALDSLGGIYFTDPAYFNNVQGEGVYYISPTGELSQVISDLSRPNGIVLSPDETTLYVAEPTATPFPGNREMKIWKYDLMSPGIPEDPSVFVDGLFADGLTIDAFGNVFAAMFQGFGAWTPEGEPIFWEQTPDATTNLVFEEPDGAYPNWLYITAGGSLYRTQFLPVPEPTTCSPENALLGDLDGDGSVAFADFLVLSANFGSDVDDYADGDVNCNGNVAFDDFLALSSNFGREIGETDAVSTPEPSACTLIAVGVPFFNVTDRRRRRSRV